MSEAGEGPVQVEKKHPVVEGARKAVRGALETNEAWRKYRENLQVKPEGKSVYRTWVDAADKVVNAMTKVDQEKFGTKMYEMKMRIAAGAFQIASTPLDVAVNVLSWLPRKGLIVAGALTTPLAGLGAPLLGAGLAMESMVRGGFTRKIGLKYAEHHATQRIWRYKIAETKEAVKHAGGFVGERVKQIIGGFAYPEQKQPPAAKV